MSVNVDGLRIFTKEMTSLSVTEVIECPDCGFEFASKHENDNSEGCYECPACNEANLQTELYFRKQYEGFLKSVIGSGETISDEQTFEWFCENIK